MAIVELRVEVIVKIVCVALLSWHVGAEVAASHDGSDTPANPDAMAKQPLIRSSCLLILGGSNARDGLSAAQSSTSRCPALNLAVSAEMGDFDRYLGWVDGKANAEVVIYSSVLMLSAAPPSNGHLPDGVEHVTPIAGMLRKRFSPEPKDAAVKFTASGDVLKYRCTRAFPVHPFETKGFERATTSVVAELVRRTEAIKRATGAEDVFLHIPRMLMMGRHDGVRARRLAALISARVTAARAAGLHVLPTTVLHHDRSLFCDDRHGDRRGREAFTAEVIGALSMAPLPLANRAPMAEIVNAD